MWLYCQNAILTLPLSSRGHTQNQVVLVVPFVSVDKIIPGDHSRECFLHHFTMVFLFYTVLSMDTLERSAPCARYRVMSQRDKGNQNTVDSAYNGKSIKLGKRISIPSGFKDQCF